MAIDLCDVADVLRCNPSPDDEMFRALVIRALLGIVTSSATFAPATDDSTDLGSPALRFQDAFLSGDIVLSPTQGVIRQSTTDGTDNASSELWSGSTESAGRGGKVQVYGNEHATRPGWAVVNAGNIPGAVVYLTADGSTTGRVEIAVGSADGTFRLSVGGALKWQTNVAGSLVSQSVAAGIVNHVTGTITAAGATQGTATLLTDIINIVGTSAAAANGVILPVAVAGITYSVFNDDAADSVLVYPPTGGEINKLGANTPFTLLTGQGAQFIAHTTTRFFTTPV